MTFAASPHPATTDHRTPTHDHGLPVPAGFAPGDRVRVGAPSTPALVRGSDGRWSAPGTEWAGEGQVIAYLSDDDGNGLRLMHLLRFEPMPADPALPLPGTLLEELPDLDPASLWLPYTTAEDAADRLRPHSRVRPTAGAGSDLRWAMTGTELIWTLGAFTVVPGVFTGVEISRRPETGAIYLRATSPHAYPITAAYIPAVRP